MALEEHSSSERIRILVMHKVRVIKDGLASLLRRSSAFTVVDLSPRETGYKEKQEGSTVDVVLAISELPANTAVNQIKKIKNVFPDAKVVIIGVLGTEKESLEFIEAGVSGYVLPDSALESLMEIIKTVYRGEASCPPDMLAILFERIASLRTQLQIVQNNDMGSLTQREMEVLQLITNGMSNKEIALYLNLEVQTVKNHVHNILEKLRVSNRREAVACTRKFGLVVANDSELPV